MGRKTWDSLGRPLPGRLNLVVSRQPDLQLEGAEVFASLEAAIERAEAWAVEQGVSEVMLIGTAPADNHPPASLDAAQVDTATIINDARFLLFVVLYRGPERRGAAIACCSWRMAALMTCGVRMRSIQELNSKRKR